MTAPSTVLPQEARDRFRAEAEAITRIYKNPIDRREALDWAIAKLHNEYPQAFNPESLA